MSNSLLTPVVPSSAWNETVNPYPQVCVHELFEEQAERTPNRIAASFEEQNISYQALNERANQLAVYLVNLGIGPEQLVGLCLNRSLDMLLAMVAVLKAGGAYVFLDPSYPAERLSFMLEDSQASLLVTEGNLCTELPLKFHKILLLDQERNAIASEPKENPNVRLTPHNLAYVLYTSGSTGKPKGVQIEHRSVVNLLTSMSKSLAFGADDVLLAITTVSFDIAALELFLPLVTGARVVIADRNTGIDTRRLMSALNSNAITVMQATPVTWRMLMDAGWRDDKLMALCGGEALGRDLAARLIESSRAVWNLYGPTETTIWSAMHRVTRAASPVVPIGKPILNTQMHVLDEDLDPVPVGESGELYIGGDGLARGYLNRPELTTRNFIESPFEPGARLYKTGDVARYLPTGDIEFLGRTDHQVKIRGFRVELGEIESVLQEHPGILHAAVMSRKVGENTSLTAYFVNRPGTVTSGTELRRWTRQHLPEYMTPSTFLRLEVMPLTFNGKIDRRQLPQVTHDDLRDDVSLPAGNDLESRLVGIWEEILGKRGIGVESDFFDLGGYSVLAVKLVQHLNEVLGTELPILAIYQAPTIKQLSAILNQHLGLREVASHLNLSGRAEPSTAGARLAKSPWKRALNRILHLLSRLLPGANSVRPFLHRLRGVHIEEEVFVGDDVYLENEFPECVEVQRGATISLRTTILAHTGGAGRIVIGKNAFIGANSVLVTAGNRTLTIGEGSVLMAGSVVTTDVPPFTVYGVERARPLARLSKPLTAKTSYDEFVTYLRPL